GATCPLTGVTKPEPWVLRAGRVTGGRACARMRRIIRVFGREKGTPTMVDKPGAGEPGASSDADRSVSDLLSDATGNLSRLVRLELRLAKLEAKHDAVRIGKGIAEFLVAAVILHIFVILLSVTVGFGLHEIFGLPAWAALGIVTLIYLLVALVFV